MVFLGLELVDGMEVLVSLEFVVGVVGGRWGVGFGFLMGYGVFFWVFFEV